MTKSQEKAIEGIRKLVERDLRDSQEIKMWEIKEHETFVSVYVAYGLKNDEGTLAELLCRDKAHLFVGKRGGVTYPIYKNGRQIERKFKGYSILQAVVDQEKY
jgi:hypothetical protein